MSEQTPTSAAITLFTPVLWSMLPNFKWTCPYILNVEESSWQNMSISIFHSSVLFIGFISHDKSVILFIAKLRSSSMVLSKAFTAFVTSRSVTTVSQWTCKPSVVSYYGPSHCWSLFQRLWDSPNQAVTPYIAHRIWKISHDLFYSFLLLLDRDALQLIAVKRLQSETSIFLRHCNLMAVQTAISPSDCIPILQKVDVTTPPSLFQKLPSRSSHVFWTTTQKYI